MKTSLRKFYRVSEDFKIYTFANKERIKQIKSFYRSNKKYFGKNILDLMCGGGVLGLLLGNAGYNYTGIDSNPDMINDAKRHINKTKSNIKFILADVGDHNLSGNFNTVTLLGNSLAHVNANEFIDILNKVDACVKKGSYFIIGYKDIVHMLAHNKWKKRMIEKNKGKKVISVTIVTDTRDGYILKEDEDAKTKEKVKFTHYIWSPFIIEALMKSCGWNLVKRREEKRWNAWTDIYRKI